MPTLRDSARDAISAILQKYPTKRSAVLPLCHLAQKEYGYMSPEAVREASNRLRQQVHRVVIGQKRVVNLLLVALLSETLPPQLLPVLLFCVACLVAFATGSSPPASSWR